LILRFGLAGLINTGFGFAVIAGLDLGLHVRPAIANAAGYAFGICIGFILNRNFVFKSRTTVFTAGERYLIAMLVAFSLNQIVLQIAGRVLGSGYYPHLGAQLVGMVTYTMTSFVACRYWVFVGEEFPRSGATQSADSFVLGKLAKSKLW
jgi:putative flippase GtrA